MRLNDKFSGAVKIHYTHSLHHCFRRSISLLPSMAAAMAMTAAAAATARPLPKSPFLNLQPRNTSLQVAICRSFPKTLGVAAAPRTTTPRAAASASASSPSASASPTSFHGPCFVLGDNIDTDQIIPAEHLTLVPSNPDEYRKLGSLALIGLPAAFHSVPFITPPSTTTRFPIIIAGANFGCGSSREHAPVALGAAGCQVVVAEYYARIFFRNSVATGEIYPLELEATGLWKECTTGDVVTVDLAGSRLINHTTGIEYKLKPIGDAGPVIEAGGIFAYARKTGMIASKA